jgi:hypothetical protein
MTSVTRSVSPNRTSQFRWKAARLGRSITNRSGLLQRAYLADQMDGMNYSRAELCSAAQYFDARLSRITSG